MFSRRIYFCDILNSLRCFLFAFCLLSHLHCLYIESVKTEHVQFVFTQEAGVSTMIYGERAFFFILSRPKIETNKSSKLHFQNIEKQTAANGFVYAAR